METIVLIRPYQDETLKQLCYPIGLGYLAAYLRKNNYNVIIYDLNVLKTTNEEFLKYIENKKVDFIGISVLTYFFHSTIKFCNLCKKSKKLNKIPIILGGTHTSALPEYSLRKTNADFAVIGEGEITLCELMHHFSKGIDLNKVDGIGFLKNDEYIQTTPRSLVRNLDDLPPPAWDLIHPERYPKNPHGFYYKRSPIFPIFTSRGCPNLCTFCASAAVWDRRIRFHSIKRIVDEIEYLVENYGAKEIHIWDDNFTLKRDRVIEFCKEIHRRKLELKFACPSGVRVDTLDEVLLKYMKSIGFWSLSIAIESGSQRVLKEIKKNLDLSIVSDVVNTSRKLGFFTRAFFIYGLPTETINTIHETLKFALKLKIEQAQFTFFSPLPGSMFFKNWIKNKNLDEIEWKKFDFYVNPQNLEGFNSVSIKEIFKFQRFLHIKFNIIRPYILVKNILRWRFSNYIIQLNRIRFVIQNLLR